MGQEASEGIMREEEEVLKGVGMEKPVKQVAGAGCGTAGLEGLGKERSRGRKGRGMRRPAREKTNEESNGTPPGRHGGESKHQSHAIPSLDFLLYCVSQQ